MSYRYANGNTPQQQAAADHRYRQTQQQLRAWTDEIAAHLGLTRAELVTRLSPELVSELVRRHYTPVST